MKNIKVLLMDKVASLALTYSEITVFSTCSSGRVYEPELSQDLKDEIKAACKK